MQAINAYLNFSGNTEQAFQFYRSVFGGEFAILQRFGDTPAGAQTPVGDRNKIMHIALPLKCGAVLMATDACESMGQKLVMGDNFSLSIAADDEAEVTRLFNALSAGGAPTLPPQKMFWGAFFAMCTDRFGVQWMMNHLYPTSSGA